MVVGISQSGAEDGRREHEKEFCKPPAGTKYHDSWLNQVYSLNNVKHVVTSALRFFKFLIALSTSS
jgi:hypothetical protein